MFAMRGDKVRFNERQIAAQHGEVGMAQV